MIDLPFQGDYLMLGIDPSVSPWVELSWAFSLSTELNLSILPLQSVKYYF
jgi:hypothetical protein